jgi:hypothetical protein
LTIFKGLRLPEGCTVTMEEADGVQRPLPMRLDVRNHSPAGFEWGYGGSGPAQLALALLLQVTEPHLAETTYQDFKWKVVSRWNGPAWLITRGQIRQWLDRHLAANPDAIDLANRLKEWDEGCETRQEGSSPGPTQTGTN